MRDMPKKCPYCSQPLSISYVGSTIREQCSDPRCRSHFFDVGNKVVAQDFLGLGVGSVYDVRTDKKAVKIYLVEFRAYSTRKFYENELKHHLYDQNTKVKYRIGSSKKHSVGTVVDIDLSPESGEIHYELLDSDGKFVNVSEIQIDGVLEDPVSEFFKGNISNPKKFLLHLWSVQFKDYYSQNTLKIVTNSRLSILPYQISVAHRLLKSGGARFILADEVGLGKTIEAGIFIKEMLARNLAKRVLIVSPASLTGQWEFEMKNKFHMNFFRLDSHAMKDIEIDYKSGSFFHKKQGHHKQLCSATLQYARLDRCAKQLQKIEWDIVVFDEAHHLRRHLENRKTNRFRTTLGYDLARELSEKTRSLLLLTATPIQLHSFDLYTLVDLLNPYAFSDFNEFETARKRI